jgi:nitrite reductase (NADH) small subunit
MTVVTFDIPVEHPSTGPAEPGTPEPGTPDPARWVRVCRVDELIPGRGVAALLNPGAADEPQLQAAVFRVGAGRLYAVGNLDPFSAACVVSRGLVGSRDGVPTVASPMLKHVFDLCTGRCVDGPAGPDPEHVLPVYPVRCVDGTVLVGVPAARPRPAANPAADLTTNGE